MRELEQERIDLLVRATRAGLLDWDAAADTNTYSARFKEMLGYPAEADTAGWPPFFDFVHPEDRERIRASFQAQLRDRRVKSGVVTSDDPDDYRLRRADGSWLWIHAEAIRLTDAEGRTLRYICSFIDISERKKLELELSDRAAFTNQLFESVPVQLAMRDPQGRFMYVNRIWERNFGFARADVIGRTPHEFRSAADADANLEMDRVAFERHARSPGDPLPPEERTIQGRRFLQQRSVVSDAGGRPLGVIVASVDMSERHAVEEQLRRSESRYGAAMRAINEGVYDWNVADGTIYYSEGVYRALGMPASMKTPQDWSERIHPEDLARYNDAIVAHLKGRTDRFECDYRFRGGDGSWRWARQHGLAIRDEQGRAVRMIGATGDITELKLAEIDLRDQMTLTRALIEENPSAMYLKDTQGRYVTVNDAWLKMVGLRREQAIGRNVLELFPEKESERYHAEDMRLLQQGAGLSEVESLRTGPDGKPQWVIIRKAVLRRADGTVTGLIGTNTDITERKKVEADLAAERKYVADLLDSLPVAVAMRDTEGKYLLVNRRWEEYFGARRDEVVGRSVRERASARMAEAVLALDREVLQRGPGAMLQEDDFDYRGRKFSQTRSVMADQQGRVLGVLVASLDTTERAAMDARLHEQIALTNAIVSQAPNSIFAKDREGRFTLANRGWSEMSGKSAAEAIGKTVHQLYPAEAAGRFAAEDEKLLAQGADAAPIESLHQGPRPGQYRIVRKAVLSRDGEVLGLVCSSTDISELKRMEQDLAHERERLALLVRSTKAGFMDWDAIADTRVYSPRFKEMLGYPADADTSQWPSLFEMVHPQDREATRDAFRDMLRSGAATGERMHGPLECRLRKADGSYLWVRGEGISQMDAEGRTTRFLASYIDITQLREMNLALEESVRLREEVDRISRHDLKTPLNSIIMIPRLLRDSGRLQAEDAELLAFVEQSGYRLLSMVNLSLDMFRMEQGSYPFSPKAVDLRATLQNVARDVAASAQSYGVTLAIEGDPRHALGEELLCYSLLANLVKNAIEASPAAGRVTLRLCGTKEEAWVEVHNAGTVPEEVRARFFDKYSTSGKKSGTGLGTYSARLMARTQRGDLTMYTSEADGTTLRLRLKAAQAPAPQSQAIGASEAGQAAPPASLSVLVVDDDEYTRVFVQRFMPPSMRTATAADGRQALEMFRREPRDVVVMDLDMPVMGGLEAAKAMRRHERENAGQGRAILLAMSSHDDPATAERALAAGFDRYLSKPVSPDAIRRAINDLTQTDQVLLDPDLKGALPGFLESRRELIDQLAGALERGDAEPARALAHKLAGSFALYGFRWAAAQGKMIEQRAREQRLDGLAAEVAALRRHLDTVDVTVKAEVRP